MRIKGLSQVGMAVKDLKKSLRFYTEVLEFPIISIKELPSGVIKEVYGLKDDQKVKFAVLRTGWGTIIELFELPHLKSGAKADPDRPAMTHVALDVGNIKRAKKRLAEAGIDTVSGPMLVEGTEVMFLKDPDGHLVELIDMGIFYYINRYIGSIVGSLISKLKYGDLDKI
ncbi:MAG: VOC family protein [Deltaproteobacteria bacterium]|uniref:VOC family protein n=1 Tax=Candidatus Zymogenus saltonus TaxID=2844893 RepID=A0A9D8KCJ1_9DELT|nr:VOC family protein [Candidatus Zymogenus saltonus]